MILGIDNGVSGCMAFYDGAELLIYDMPTFEIKNRNVLNIVRIVEILKTNLPQKCFVEQLLPYGQGGAMQNFSMGNSEGVFLGVLTALQIPFEFVRPGIWKKTMRCTADKDSARQRASELLPTFAHNWDLKKHHGRAEASLIALYGRGKYEPQ